MHHERTRATQTMRLCDQMLKRHKGNERYCYANTPLSWRVAFFSFSRWLLEPFVCSFAGAVWHIIFVCILFHFILFGSLATRCSQAPFFSLFLSLCVFAAVIFTFSLFSSERMFYGMRPANAKVIIVTRRWFIQIHFHATWCTLYTGVNTLNRRDQIISTCIMKCDKYRKDEAATESKAQNTNTHTHRKIYIHTHTKQWFQLNMCNSTRKN